MREAVCCDTCSMGPGCEAGFALRRAPAHHLYVPGAPSNCLYARDLKAAGSLLGALMQRAFTRLRPAKPLMLAGTPPRWVWLRWQLQPCDGRCDGPKVESTMPSTPSC